MDDKLNSPTSPNSQEPRGRAEEKSSQNHEGRTHRDHHSRDRDKERDRDHHHHHYHSESREHLRRSRDSRDHHDHHSSHHHSSQDRDRERDRDREHLRKSRDRDHHDHHTSHHSSHDRERDREHHHHSSHSSHSRDRDHHEHHGSHHRDYHYQAQKIIQKCLAEDIATEKLQELWNLYDTKKRGCLGEHEGTKFLKDVWCVHAKLHGSKICDLLPKELSEQEALKVSFQGLAGPEGTLCWETFFRFMKSGAGNEKKSPDRSPSPEKDITTKSNPFSCPDLSTSKKMDSQANLHSHREHNNTPRYASHSHSSPHHSSHHSSHHHTHHYTRRAHSTHHLSRGRSEDDLKHVTEQLTELTKKVLTLEQERASTHPLLRTVS